MLLSDGNGQRIAFLTAAVLAHICFGLYMMVMERRRDAGMAVALPKMPVALPELNTATDTVPKEERVSAFDDESGIHPTDLLQRVELMEQMIAEGRQATGRFGWLFVLFGAGYFVGIGWEWISRRHWQGGGRAWMAGVGAVGRSPSHGRCDRQQDQAASAATLWREQESPVAGVWIGVACHGLLAPCL